MKPSICGGAPVFSDPGQQHFLANSASAVDKSVQQQHHLPHQLVSHQDFRALAFPSSSNSVAALAAVCPNRSGVPAPPAAATDWPAAAARTASHSHKMTAAKFEPIGGQQLGTGIPPMLSAATASSSSAASSAAAAAASLSAANPYCWPMGTDWELAARTTEARLALGSQPATAYYDMAAAAAAMSAASAASSGPAAVWYPQAYQQYYGGLAQRAAAGSTVLNGYLSAAGPYAGVYGSPADYYSGTSAAAFPSYYAAALSNASGSADPSSIKAFAQYSQQYAAAVGVVECHQNATALLDLQGGVTGSELDSSPLGAARTSPSAAQQILSVHQQQNGNGSVREKAGGKAEKSTTSSSSKRSKKKKGTVRSSPSEPNTTRVFVWELEDICAVLPQHNQYCHLLEQMLTGALHKLLQAGFQLDQLEEYDQANVEDAQLDEALQNAAAASCVQQQNGGAAAFSTSGEGGGGESSSSNGGQCQQQTETETHQPSGQTPQATGGVGPRQSAASEGLRRLAAKYRHIRDVYERHRGGGRLGVLLEQCGIGAAEFLTQMDHVERMLDANLELFRDCLRVIAERSMLLPFRCANVVLSSNANEAGVAGALGRLLLCRMGDYVQPEHVFCTARTGKEAALERLANQFQKKLLVLITANEESRQLAYKEGLPCWFLYSNTDLVKFRSALDILVGDLLGPPLAATEQPGCPNNNFLTVRG